jgi:hypothetical protein
MKRKRTGLLVMVALGPSTYAQWRGAPASDIDVDIHAGVTMESSASASACARAGAASKITSSPAAKSSIISVSLNAMVNPPNEIRSAVTIE